MIRPQSSDVMQIVRGFLMGGADIIPGVSGGTVALVLGIYQRLVTAISHVDAHFFKLLSQREWVKAAEYLDLRFLVGLGIGILTGVASLAGLMRFLLLEQRSYTLAVFFGLILGSSLIVARMVRPQSLEQFLGCLLLSVLAACFAFWLVGQEQVRFHDNLGYFFLCGMIAICAMILPGISGAYILWLMGAYAVVTGIIHNAAKLQFKSQDLLSLGVFACGCLVGLVCFSKLLKWLLEHAHKIMMSVLGGFMIGSLRLMWPFQIDKTPTVEKLKLKDFKRIMPEEWNQEVTLCLILAVSAFAAILLLEYLSGGVGEETAPQES